MVRTTSIVTVGGLNELETRFRRLGVAFGPNAQAAPNEVAASALKRLQPVFETVIEQPVASTAIKPTGRSSSVVRDRGRWADGDAEIASQVRVSDLQSRYLKYQLGEEDTRLPGDAGVASEWNFIPMRDADDALEEQGAMVRNGQNLGRGLLRRLFRRAEQQRAKIRTAWAAGRRVSMTGSLRYRQLFFGRSPGKCCQQ